MTRLVFLIALIWIMLLGGCIVAARKGIGTLIGPKGKMEIVEQHGSVLPGEHIATVQIHNEVGDSVSAENLRVLQSQIQTQLQAADLYGGGDLKLSMTLTNYTDRPAKKVLELEAVLSRNGDSLATAKLDVNLNGFAEHGAVADAIGKAVVYFLQQVSG
jgi:hypothetical protein